MERRRRTRPGVRRCVAGVLVVLLALPAAPFAALRRSCEHCPPACPMHRKTARLGCHTARSAGAPHGCARQLGLGAPGCAREREVSAVSSHRALAPRSLLASPLVARPVPRPVPLTARTRAADPPEPPPPRATLLG